MGHHHHQTPTQTQPPPQPPPTPTPHSCKDCSKSFATPSNLYRHIRTHHVDSHLCETCGKVFARHQNYENHPCRRVNVKVRTRHNIVIDDDDENVFAPNDDVTEEGNTASAFKGLFNSHTWKIRNATDPLSLIAKYDPHIKRVMIRSLSDHGPVKENMVMEITMNKIDQKNKKKVTKTAYFHGGSRTMLRSSQLPEMIQESATKIGHSFDAFVQNGSGWVLQSIDYLRLFTAKYVPILGKSYIQTPTEIKGKRAIINVQNEDNRCFEYSIICSQHYNWIDQNHSYSPAQYTPWLGKYNFDGCSTPMELDQITKFEKNNGLSINVFTMLHNGKQVSPLRITNNEEARLEDMINLLLIEGTQTTHYTWIINLDRLLHRGDHHTRKYCPFCCTG